MHPPLPGRCARTPPGGWDPRASLPQPLPALRWPSPIYKLLLIYCQRPVARNLHARRPQVCRKTARPCSVEERHMIAKLLLQNSAFVLAMGALLFASAGTLHWPGAWAFLVTSAVLGPACG